MREKKIAVVEAYLECFRTKDPSVVPFAENVTFEGPLMPRLTDRQSVLSFLRAILPLVERVHVKQHIVEGDYVATVFDMETINGMDHVVDTIHIVDDQIKEIRAFYYPHHS